MTRSRLQPPVLLCALALCCLIACDDEAADTTPSAPSTAATPTKGSSAETTGKGQVAKGTQGTNKTRTAPDASAAKDVPPAPPSSPLAAATTQSEQPLRSPENISTALAQAKSLDEWGQAHPDHADTAAVTTLASRLRVLAVAASVGIGTKPAQNALGKPALEHLNKVITQHANDAAHPALVAAKAIAGANPGDKTNQLDRAAALKLIASDDPLGGAVAAVWLSHLEQALQALRGTAPELRLSEVSRTAGRLLCKECADAHQWTADKVMSFLLNARNKGGIICDVALARESATKSLEEQLAAISLCAKPLGAADRVDEVSYWGTNLLALGVLRTAQQILSTVQLTSPMKPALEKRIASTKNQLQGHLVLPVGLLTTTPTPGDQAAPAGARPVELTGLGDNGLTISDIALDTYIVGHDAVRRSMPAIVSMSKEGEIQSPPNAIPSRGIQVMSLADLENAKLNADTGGVDELTSQAELVKKVTDTLHAHVRPKPTKGDASGRVANIVVDAAAPAWAVERTLDSLNAAGYAHFRFPKTGTHGNSLPLLVRQSSDATLTKAGARFERPVIAVVSPKYIDVWRPTKPKGEAPTADKKASLPKGVTPGYRGKDLQRLRISISPETGLDKDALSRVKAAFDFSEKRWGAGSVAHVIAGKNAIAADVLRVANAYQQRGAKPLKNSAELWPGTRCGGPDFKRLGVEPAGCHAAAAIAFSRTKAPSGRGLTNKIVKDKPAEKKAAAGFCEKKDIARGMRKRTGAFRFCYERELQLKKNLSGKVVVRFRIGKNGQVTGSPSIASASLKDPRVHRCILKNVKKLKFKPPEGGTCTVRWPFKFRPR